MCSVGRTPYRGVRPRVPVAQIAVYQVPIPENCVSSVFADRSHSDRATLTELEAVVAADFDDYRIL